MSYKRDLNVILHFFIIFCSCAARFRDPYVIFFNPNTYFIHTPNRPPPYVVGVTKRSLFFSPLSSLSFSTFQPFVLSMRTMFFHGIGELRLCPVWAAAAPHEIIVGSTYPQCVQKNPSCVTGTTDRPNYRSSSCAPVIPYHRIQRGLEESAKAWQSLERQKLTARDGPRKGLSH